MSDTLTYEELTEERDRLAVELQRAQEALEAIATHRQSADDWGHPDFDWRMVARKQEDIARIALMPAWTRDGLSPGDIQAEYRL